MLLVGTLCCLEAFLAHFFSVLQFIASPFTGAVSDVYGRRPVMICTSVGIALSYAVWAMSGNFTIFVIARVIGGISKGNISLSYAIISDVLSLEKRTKGMILIGVAFSIGFLIGPLIGAYFSYQARQIAQNSTAFFSTPSLFALLLAVVNVIFLLLCFQETLPYEKRIRSLELGFKHVWPLVNPGMLFNFAAVKDCSQSAIQSMRKITMVYFTYLLIFSGLEFTLTFVTHGRFEFDSIQQGKMFFMIGIVMITIQGGFMRRMKPGREYFIAAVGIVFLIPSFIVIAFAHHEIFLYLGLILFAFASATVPPCLTGAVSALCNSQQKGTVFGIFRSVGALARAFGPVVASVVYWSVGPTTCYVIGGLALLIPLYSLTGIKQRDQ